MHLNSYFEKLKENTLMFDEYKSMHQQCLRLVAKACRRYEMSRILLNTALREGVFEHIYLKSILKTLDNYDKKRSSFTTYFYYKACSAARNEAAKFKRRMQLVNTFELKEDVYEQKNQVYNSMLRRV